MKSKKCPGIIDCVQYTCNNYGRYGNVMCTAHTIEARDLFNADRGLGTNLRIWRCSQSISVAVMTA